MDDDRSSVQAATEPQKAEPESIETRVTDFVRLGVLGLFAYWSLTLVAPFAIIVVWAGILAVALYPLYSMLRTLLGGHERLAAILVTLAGLLLIIGPVAAIALNFIDAAHIILAKLKGGGFTMPVPSESVKDWPVIGDRVYSAWSNASSNLGETLYQMKSSLLEAGSVALSKIAGVGSDVLRFVAAVIVAGFLLRPGPHLGDTLKGFARRIAPERGVGFVNLAAATIRNVARGVIGVALLQMLLSGVIFGMFGVPVAGLLAFAVLIFCIIQIGPAVVLLPVIIWAWTAWEWKPALAFTLLLVPVLVIDNVVKPMLVARGLSTPMLVILIGVIGGTLAYGLVGLFLGPIVLSVFYDLLAVWVRLPPPGSGKSPPA